MFTPCPRSSPGKGETGKEDGSCTHPRDQNLCPGGRECCLYSGWPCAQLRICSVAFDQGSASFSFKGPDSKYYRLHRPYGLCRDDSTLMTWLQRSEGRGEMTERKASFIATGGGLDLVRRLSFDPPLLEGEDAGSALVG